MLIEDIRYKLFLRAEMAPRDFLGGSAVSGTVLRTRFITDFLVSTLKGFGFQW